MIFTQFMQQMMSLLHQNTYSVVLLSPGHDGDHEPDDEAPVRAVFQAGRMVLRRKRPPRRRGVHRRPAEEQAQVSWETLHTQLNFSI